jgi:hypothetical protein
MNKLILTLILLIWTSIASSGEITGTMLLYQKSEPGIDPYLSRLIITDKFMRMDEGEDPGNYLLFDRNKRHIYSITHDDRTVFEIPQRQVRLEPPEVLNRVTKKVDSTDMPKVAGKQPEHYRLNVNGQECYNVITVSGLLENAVDVMRDFRVVLAGEHAKALSFIPADVRNICEMALHTFHPEWQLEFGLPIQEWDDLGNSQSLINFKGEILFDEQLFELPEGYQHYSTDSL